MATLSPAEAFVAVAYCAAFADGAMGFDEDAHLAEDLATVRPLEHLNEEELRAAMTKVDAMAQDEGEAVVLAAAAAALSPEMRTKAFTMGVDIALADGELADEERGFIERLRAELDIDPAFAQRVVDVFVIRNGA